MCPVDLLNGDQMKPESTRLNPNQKMPVLEEDGFALWESNAIIQVPRGEKPESGLDASGAPGPGRRTAMAVLGQRALGPCLRHAGVREAGQGGPTPSEIEAGVRRFAAVLNMSLGGRRFLCGDRLTLADFAVGAWLNYAEPAGHPIGDFREINRWYAALMELPAWRGSIVRPPL